MKNIELHVHPFLDNYTIVHVVDAMDETNLDILALEGFNFSIYPIVLEKAKTICNVKSDDAGIKLPNGKYLLNAREYTTKEDLHVLTVGYSLDDAAPETEIRRIIDNGLEHKALVILDHPFVDNVKTKTIGHISLEMEQDLEELCKEYSGQIALEWNGYCNPWIRMVLKSLLNLARFDIQYHDVNQKVENLSSKLEEQGYNLPVVADTDVHARNKKHLLKIGTARLITDIEGEYASDIISSMKKNIFDGNYENVKNHVGPKHLFGAFFLPILFEDRFENPRG